jgi:hypothetical protein|tara:strand:- start:46 stop:243 length:198 start_codon:yes stop_codon:yes gene_type:complete
MTVIKKVIGSCFFEYISEFDSEEKALSGLDGTFKEVKVSNLKKERTLITKENDDSKSEGTPKAKG